MVPFFHGKARDVYRHIELYTSACLQQGFDTISELRKPVKNMLKILSKEKGVSNGIPRRSDLSCGITVFSLMIMTMDFMCLFNLPVMPV